MKPKNKTVLFDILIGVVSAALSFMLFQFFSFGIALIITAPIPIIAGFIRGKNSEESKLVKVALMNILFYPLVAAIMNGVFYVVLIIATAVIGTIIGINIRRDFFKSKLKICTYTFIFFMSIIFLGLFVLPIYIDSLMWDKELAAAPQYKFLSPQKDTIRSTDNSNKVVVLEFWATWCGPCKKQLPVMEEIYKKYKDNNKIAFFIINPCGRDKFEKVVEFIKKNSYDLPFVMDIESTTTKKFKITSLPTLIIIDKKGIIRLTHYGYNKSERFQKIFCSQVDSLMEKN